MTGVKTSRELAKLEGLEIPTPESGSEQPSSNGACLPPGKS